MVAEANKRGEIACARRSSYASADRARCTRCSRPTPPATEPCSRFPHRMPDEMGIRRHTCPHRAVRNSSLCGAPDQASGPRRGRCSGFAGSLPSSAVGLAGCKPAPFATVACSVPSPSGFCYSPSFIAAVEHAADEMGIRQSSRLRTSSELFKLNHGAPTQASDPAHAAAHQHARRAPARRRAAAHGARGFSTAPARGEPAQSMVRANFRISENRSIKVS